MGRKQKKWTKTQVKKLIKEVASATQDEVWGRLLANIISAMRGPDFEDDDDIKAKYTIPLRQAVGWRCGLMHSDPAFGLSVLTPPLTANNAHYFNHIDYARKSLRELGLVKE